MENKERLSDVIDINDDDILVKQNNIIKKSNLKIESYSYFEFEINDNRKSYTISAKNKSDIPYMISIPSEYEDLPVTKIKKDAFSECENLGIVIFEDNSNIKSIGSFAFYKCVSLESIELPESIENIKTAVFHSCSKLQQVYLNSKYPAKLERIVFVQNSPYLEFYVPEEAIEVYKSFYNWNEYKDLIFPFKENIPSSLGFFRFELNDDEKSYTVYAKNRDDLPDNLVIPSFYNKKYVTVIGEDGFRNSNFSSLILPEKLVVIKSQAFYWNIYLEELIIPDTVEVIESYAFFKTISRSYPYTYAEVPALKKVVFGENSKLKYIGNRAFLGNLNLKEFKLPKGVKFIGDNSLFGTGISSIDISEGLETIEGNPFEWCFNLKEIHVDERNEYYKDIEGVLYNKDETKAVSYPVGRDDYKYSIQSTVKSIASHYMFYKWSKDDNFRVLYVNSLEPPELDYKFMFELQSVKIYVPSNSYEKYINAPVWKYLSDIIYPNNIINKGLAIKNNSLIQYVGNESEITIPKNIMYVQDYALSNCKNLKNVYLEYDNVSLKSVDGVLFNNDMTKLIYYPEAKPEEEYEIPEQVTILGIASFLQCKNLVKIKTHKELQVIGSYNFYMCENLKEISNIDMQDNIKVIEDYVLYMCDLIEKIKLMSIEKIGKYVAYRCQNLNEITFGAMLKYMPEYNDFACENLKKINIFALEPPKIELLTSMDNKLDIYVPKESMELYKESAWCFYEYYSHVYRYKHDIYQLKDKIVYK
ncbi:leucine-rich repeat domain-containing protein [Clostridium sp. BJN0001]|uniref:leucine-rich repeat domain-containing protein n=1 Tax=Clostridium sp. BJN0001 TaxID=2930219 RepID=UPI001FD6062E|nr:leucine-rich repeat domain-containing protein [Clostridium sp. BJN0001]